MASIATINNVSNGALYDAESPVPSKTWSVRSPQVGNLPAEYRNKYGMTAGEDGRLTVLSTSNIKSGISRVKLRITFPHVTTGTTGDCGSSCTSVTHFEQVDVSFTSSDKSELKDRERMLSVLTGILSDAVITDAIENNGIIY
jgi:hypothetical protein